jgi:predicted nucleic acid-binding Zn ribbon protein
MASLPVASSAATRDDCVDIESEPLPMQRQRLRENPLFWMVTAAFALMVIGVTLSYTLALETPKEATVAVALSSTAE